MVVDKRFIAQRIAAQSIPLSETALDELASILTCTEVKKNEMFLREGEISKEFCYVYQGFIRQFYYKKNKDLTEHFAIEGQMFICIDSFLRQRPTILQVEALENTIVYGIPFGPINELILEDREIEKMYRTLLENSLIMSQRKMDALRLENANERYNRLLRDSPEIILRAPLSTVASYLQMTPETLSRVRSAQQKP